MARTACLAVNVNYVRGRSKNIGSLSGNILSQPLFKWIFTN
jgi:hypothetical protein